MKKLKNSNAFKAIIFIVVMLIPLIYSFFYLKSYWNPYGNLSDMQIAVVNLDKGKDDKNQGNEFVQSLKDSDTFKICEVSKDEAQEGMKKGNYYATIEIPENFTKCLESASTEDKQIAQVTYSPNQATNYLATQIVNSAVKTIELNLQSKIDKEIIANLASKLNEVPDSLQEISNGADTILNGTESLNDGIKQISDGTNTLSNSYKEFDEGVNSAYTGSKSLNSGISQVSDGVETLKNGGKSLDSAIDQINQGADQLSSQGAEGITELSTGVTDLNTGAKTLNDGVAEYVTGVNTLNENTEVFLNKLIKTADALGDNCDPTLKAFATQAQGFFAKDPKTNMNGFESVAVGGKKVTAGSNSLYAGTQKLAKGTEKLGTLTNGIQSLKTALTQVKQGTTSLNNGIATLQNGTTQLSKGSKSLETGLEKLSSSSSTVDNAISTLNEGSKTAYNGSNQLVEGVKTFKTSIDEGMQDTKEQLKSLNGIEEFGENPVEFKTEEYGKVDSYGIAFTPLFLCIGLWVGALMAYVVLYYDHDERFGIFGMNAKNKILQNLIYLGLGAAEGLLTGWLLKAGLGFEVQNMALYYGSSILIGITFMSIIQFLIRNFGDIGKFLALIILVLQLAAAGGTFPIETIDKAFQAVSPYLPMTYSIKLLREVLVPTASNFKGTYIGILVGIIAVTMLITFVVDIINKRKNEENA
ncbi:MAG: YhgE/Pip domain-containing protein [Clostridia bacterium]